MNPTIRKGVRHQDCDHFITICIKCSPFVVPARAATAVGRFRPEGVLGYRATDVPNAPLRASREEAQVDWIESAGDGCGR